jgi:hemerythrin-like metal-binding protein
MMERQQVLLLVIGTPAACGSAIRTLRQHAGFGGEILTCPSPREARLLLDSRKDIGLVLLLCDEPKPDGLIEAVAALIEDEMPRPVLLRCRGKLPSATRDTLWRLGTADRLFEQAIDSPDLADSVATVLRAHAQVTALGSVTAAAARLEQAGTLWELAELVLTIIHEHGIAERGSLFCLLGGFEQPRLMTVAGRGCHAGMACMPLDDAGDDRLIAAIRRAMAAGQSVFADDFAVLYLRTPENDVACIYLALEAPLSSWKRHLLGMLLKAFSISLAKNQAAQRLLRTQHATISTMATLAEYRDVDTGEHVARVARAVTEITQVLADRGHVPDADLISRIGLAAILHDVGKIAIPEAILLKPGALDAAERKTMETHTALGRDILTQAATRSDNAALLRLAAEIAYCHHEKYDGSGYPAGLKGDSIPLAARIVALVDVFDALTSLRPYKEPWPYEKVIRTIAEGSGSHFDPLVVDAFLSLEERRRSADFFVWKDEMSVGHPELDVDHQRLITIINRLWVAEGNGNRQVIEFVLDDLVHYTESHFKREEQMMAAVDYADFERHRGIHRGICRRLEEIRWEYFQGIREELRGEILEFLKNWLNQHILVEDMRYRADLRMLVS